MSYQHSIHNSKLITRPVKLPYWSEAAKGAGIAVLALGLYVKTLAPSVMPGDYAEFQMCAEVLGVPHPTGYPLYIMLGKLFTLLPLGDVAYRVNLTSAVYMASAVGLVYALSLGLLRLARLSGGWWAAALGAGLFAVAPTVWSMSLVARSYALNALLVGGVLCSLVMWRHKGEARWFYLACLLIGLSLVHHGTTYLLLPAYGLYLLLVEREWGQELLRRYAPITNYKLQITNKTQVIRNSEFGIPEGEGIGAKRQERHPARRWAGGVLAFMLGLSPMLFLVYRFLVGSPYYWGNPATWKDFFNLLTGGPFHNQVMGFGWSSQLERLAFGINELSGQYTPVGIMAGALGLFVLWRSVRAEAMLLSLMMLGNFLFAMNYSLVGYLYFIPTYLIWACCISVGVGWLLRNALDLLSNRSQVPVRVSGVLVGGTLAAAVLFAVVLRYPNIDQSGQTAVRDEALALLKVAPRGSSLYLDWEDLSVVRFYRMVYGMRPDLTLHSGDPADWAKLVYCDQSVGTASFVGEFAGAIPAVIERDFDLAPAPMGRRVLKANNTALYELPPCGACATCR